MGKRWIAGRTTAVVLSVVLLGLAGCSLFQPEMGVDFEVSETTGFTPLLVGFTPLVAEDVAYYYWDFGDGSTSIESSPVHVYRTAGTYDVFLSVTSTDGSTGQVIKKELVDVGFIVQAGPATLLYWLNKADGTITRGDMMGISEAPIAEYINKGRDLAIGKDYVFWTADDMIYRATLGGLNESAIVTNQAGLFSVSVDDVTQQIYWTCLPSDFTQNPSRKGGIKRADFNGSNISRTLTNSDGGYARWIRCDEDGERYYVSSEEYDSGGIVVPLGLEPKSLCNGRFQWTYLSDFSPHLVKKALCGIRTMALDVSGSPAQYVYWTIDDKIMRCRVDGSDTSTILSGLDNPKGIAVDLVEEVMFWSDAEGIHLAELDGSEAELIYPGVTAHVLGLLK